MTPKSSKPVTVKHETSFVFRKVLLWKLYLFPLVGVFISLIILGITWLLKSFNLAVLMGATSIGITVMFAIFNFFSKDVTVSFDTGHINFAYSGKTITYPQNEVIGFYSFNHFRDAKSTISMCFKFRDGTQIDISDFLATGKFIPEKNEMLKAFLITAQRELGFTDVAVSKIRKFGKIGSTWYSKAYH